MKKVKQNKIASHISFLLFWAKNLNISFKKSYENSLFNLNYVCNLVVLFGHIHIERIIKKYLAITEFHSVSFALQEVCRDRKP